MKEAQVAKAGIQVKVSVKLAARGLKPRVSRAKIVVK
jgi:hypothetical protein